MCRLRWTFVKMAIGLRRQRSRVDSKLQHVLDGELFDGGLHEGATNPRAGVFHSPPTPSDHARLAPAAAIVTVNRCVSVLPLGYFTSRAKTSLPLKSGCDL